MAQRQAVAGDLGGDGRLVIRVDPRPAELDLDVGARQGRRPGAPADAVARLEHQHPSPRGREIAGRDQPGEAPADDRDLHVRHLFALLTSATVAVVRSIYRGPWRIDVERRDGVPRLLPATTLARTIAAALDAAGAPVAGVDRPDPRRRRGARRAQCDPHGQGRPDGRPVVPAPPAGRLSAARRPRTGGGRDAEAEPPFTRPPGTRQHLGDIVVSVERAIDQAGAGRGGQTGDVRWGASDELRLLVTHGTLHVCGWDHAEPDEEAAMRALERRLLA